MMSLQIHCRNFKVLTASFTPIEEDIFKEAFHIEPIPVKTLGVANADIIYIFVQLIGLHYVGQVLIDSYSSSQSFQCLHNIVSLSFEGSIPSMRPGIGIRIVDKSNRVGRYVFLTGITEGNIAGLSVSG